MVRLFQISAVALLALASTVLPWATYKNQQTGVTTMFRGGELGVVLVALGVAILVLSRLAASRGSVTLGRLIVLVGCAAMVLSGIGALSKISAANNAARHAVAGSGSQTSYAIGAVLAVLATAVITLTAFVDGLGVRARVGWKRSVPT